VSAVVDRTAVVVLYLASPDHRIGRRNRQVGEGGFTVRHWWTDAAGRSAPLVAVPHRAGGAA